MKVVVFVFPKFPSLFQQKGWKKERGEDVVNLVLVFSFILFRITGFQTLTSLMMQWYLYH